MTRCEIRPDNLEPREHRVLGVRVVYVISTFPKASETFIMREVLGLRELGLDVDVISFVAPSATELARVGSVMAM